MSSHYAKPENALRKASDLLSIRKPKAALRTLDVILTSKRHRQWQPTHEQIMLMYLDLAVNQRQNVKDALVQYRLICQAAQAASLERILRHYIQLSQQKVAKIQNRSGVNIQAIEDLDETTPDDLIAAAFSGKGDTERQQRQEIVPWVRYLWETYRTILDVLRNNGRLELLYHEVTRAAFGFCLDFHRNAEFRRLCELLRHHLFTIAKFQSQQNAVDLQSPDTQRRYLETRFHQLETAAKLELWQEAYRTIEDIHENMKQCAALGIEPKPELMKTYYTKLADIFYASENHLFHAYSLHRFYVLQQQAGKQVSSGEAAADNQTLASTVLLASLVVPASEHDTAAEAEVLASEHEGSARLANLLGFKRETPTRTRLLSTITAPQNVTQVLTEALPAVQKLFHLLEEQYSPLSLNRQVKPLLDELQALNSPLITRYITQLRQLTVIRVLQQLGTVYKTIKLTKFRQLVASDAELQSASPNDPNLERIILYAVHTHQVNLRVDHSRQMLVFGEEGLESARIRDQLVHLSRALYSIVQRLEPDDAASKQQERSYVFNLIRDGVEHEHSAVFARQQEIEKRKQEYESNIAEREKRDAELRAKVAADRKAEETRRLADEAAKREQERIQREAEERELRVKQAIADQVMSRVAEAASKIGGAGIQQSAAVKKIAKLTENLSEVDVATIREAQEELVAAEKRETDRRRREALKRADYIVRAVRIEERDLLVDAEAKRRETDAEAFEADYAKFVETDRKNHSRGLQEKQRLSRSAEQRQIYMEQVMARRQQQFEEEKAKQEKIARAHAVVRVREERRRAAEAERQRQQEEQRAAAERAKAEAEAEKEREAERRREEVRQQKIAEREAADAVARKQMQREEEAERKRAERAAEQRAASRFTPSARDLEDDRVNFRSRQAPAAASESTDDVSAEPAAAAAPSDRESRFGVAARLRREQQQPSGDDVERKDAGGERKWRTAREEAGASDAPPQRSFRQRDGENAPPSDNRFSRGPRDPRAGQAPAADEGGDSRFPGRRSAGGADPRFNRDDAPRNSERPIRDFNKFRREGKDQHDKEAWEERPAQRVERSELMDRPREREE